MPEILQCSKSEGALVGISWIMPFRNTSHLKIGFTCVSLDKLTSFSKWSDRKNQTKKKIKCICTRLVCFQCTHVCNNIAQKECDQVHCIISTNSKPKLLEKKFIKYMTIVPTSTLGCRQWLTSFNGHLNTEKVVYIRFNTENSFHDLGSVPSFHVYICP